MSTNSECLFFQWNENEHYYLLEDCDAPNNAWDWREFATCYGPFQSEKQAEEHLRNNHANPGGACHIRQADKSDVILQAHVEEAKKRLANRSRRW